MEKSTNLQKVYKRMLNSWFSTEILTEISQVLCSLLTWLCRCFHSGRARKQLRKCLGRYHQQSFQSQNPKQFEWWYSRPRRRRQRVLHLIHENKASGSRKSRHWSMKSWGIRRRDRKFWRRYGIKRRGWALNPKTREGEEGRDEIFRQEKTPSYL